MNSVPKSEKAKSKPMKITRHLNGDEFTMVSSVWNYVMSLIINTDMILMSHLASALVQPCMQSLIDI